MGWVILKLDGTPASNAVVVTRNAAALGTRLRGDYETATLSHAGPV